MQASIQKLKSFSTNPFPKHITHNVREITYYPDMIREGMIKIERMPASTPFLKLSKFQLHSSITLKATQTKITGGMEIEFCSI